MELFGDRSTADDGPALNYADTHSGLGQVAGTDQTVVAAADNDDIGRTRRAHKPSSRGRSGTTLHSTDTPASG